MGEAYSPARVFWYEMTLLQGIIGSIIATIIVAIVVTLYRRATNRIKITHPRPQETLTEPEPLGGAFAFPVRGTLKRLLKGHQIWLLTQDDSKGAVWPQGFFPVEYDPSEGTWSGKINGSGKPNVRIVAVVAPPSSQDFFRYFQKLGQMRDYKFEPLSRIPPECVNQDSVQARIPKP